MKHDEKCERTDRLPVCHCAKRVFVADESWEDCLGRIPEVTEAVWLSRAKMILASDF